jgi:hypothetical protein
MELDTAFNFEAMWAEEKPFADRLAAWINYELSPRRVVDIGCGPGMYVAALRELGISAHGYDIHPGIRYGGGLEQKSMFELAEPGDVAMCIEVAEHIPVEMGRDVVAAVARNTFPGGTLIWSAAHPGQGGVGHVNCQPKEHWDRLLRQAGMVRDFALEQDMHTWIRAGYHMGWFSLNAMLFVRSLRSR